MSRQAVLKNNRCSDCGKEMPGKKKICAECKKKPKRIKVVGELKTRIMTIDDIKIAEYNPRIPLFPGDAEYEALTASIALCGYAEAIVWNRRTENLVSGHQRLKILKNEFGLTRVTVSVVDLALPLEKALNLSLNKITGQWDTAKLIKVLAELEKSIPTMLPTGFSSEEIDKLLKKSMAGSGVEISPDQTQGVVVEVYKVEVICVDQKVQEQTYDRLKGLNLVCRKITLKPKDKVEKQSDAK